MTEQELFIAADQALTTVIAKIADEQWEMKLPEWFQVGRTQHDPTLRDIINYHAYDEAWVPDTLAGKSIQQIGDKYDGDLLGNDPKASYHRLAERAESAVRDLSNPDQTVHLTYGDFPAREYLRHISSFRGFRAFDIARLIGADTKLPPALVQGMWDLLSPDMEEWRKIGVYGPAVAVPDGASLQDKLIALSGRQP